MSVKCELVEDFNVAETALPELIEVLTARREGSGFGGITIELSPAAAKAETKVTLNNVPVTEVVNYLVSFANLWRKVMDPKIVLAAYGEC